MPSAARRRQSDIRAIVLDFNGTLAQDNDLMAQIYVDTFASIGAELTVREYQRDLAALADRDLFELAMRRVGLPRNRVQRDALIEERIERYMVAVLDDPPIDDAAVEFVQSASKRVPLAIASNAFRREIEEVLASAGIDEHFSALVTIDEVSNGKPDPEPFVLALASLRARFGERRTIRPDQVAAIEDATGGALAARKAGMRVVAIRGPAFDEESGYADLVLDRLDADAFEQIMELGLE
jgi:beta-phosphoglucomutase